MPSAGNLHPPDPWQIGYDEHGQINMPIDPESHSRAPALRPCRQPRQDLSRTFNNSWVLASKVSWVKRGRDCSCKSRCASEVLATSALALRVLAGHGAASPRNLRCCCPRAHPGWRCKRNRSDGAVMPALSCVSLVSRGKPTRRESARLLAIAAQDLSQMRRIYAIAGSGLGAKADDDHQAIAHTNSKQP